ncbi:MAG: T9SS type A sorting domain-containing protein [Algoriphagus sp.]|uniref:T9SS type A sorting domain-containing protein n=1 Tax=Algoriphagus sp. TaxID=1872435 RepID=UPI0017DBE684|nr:T9SS type A sorting domain-containing protein [Algoriphagus sp.]NVJ85964.1 T9SS type A sorting domain-containing protein [Algoriphagus sp.]
MPLWHLFNGRIYRILSAFAVAIICSYGIVTAQEIGSYRTISSGNFQTIAIWEVYDGSNWIPASAPPDQNHDIYIDQTHLLTLTQNESVKSLFINAEAGAGQKLNLNGFNLDIFGTLQGFEGPAPGIPNRAWNSINWIGNSISSTLTFRGTSRVIIPQNAWSAQSDRSRYSVIFDPGPGQTLIIEEAFKALSFTIRSGTVIQRLDTSVNPAKCATFSFNTETTVYGTGPYGEFTIEGGAQLISECDEGILFRSSSISALLFSVLPGGELILEGETPQIEAANFQLNGKIIHRGGSGPKSFLSKSYPDAAIPNSIHDLELQGSENLTLPPELFITGDLIQSGSGEIIANSSHLHFVGTSDQRVEGFPLTTENLTLNKPTGEVITEENISISHTFFIQSGSLNLNGNGLEVNSSGLGGISYSGGSWKNVDVFTYLNTPTILTAINGTFPFEDVRNGGNRTVQLLGNTDGGNLEIRFTEYEGAEYNSGFNDTDGTTILYRLFSYFQFSGLNPSTEELKMRISADQLIVDDVDDLRIVGTGYAAPGSNLPGLDPVLLWARRLVPINDLEGINFTVGSFRTLSILPIDFLSFEVNRLNSKSILTWEVANSNPGIFTIYRSLEPTKNWDKLIEIPVQDQSRYEFIDHSASLFYPSYYRIKHSEDLSNLHSWSSTILLTPIGILPETGIIFPNPHSSGPISIEIPKALINQPINSQVINQAGISIWYAPHKRKNLEQFLENVAPGTYLIRIFTSEQMFTFRWVKK